MTASRGRGQPWRNWSGSQSVLPRRRESPATVEELRRIVAAASRAGRRVKAVGSGHSHSGIAVAPDILVDLGRLVGLVSVDRERSRATLLAGTPLHLVPALLAPFGLAMENLSDIDEQTVAGAVSTGTHGTGIRFGSLATQVAGVALVTAEGELLHVDDQTHADLLPAVALSLGALGVLAEVTLQCVPAFVLHSLELPEPLGQVRSALAERARGADHFEFFWFPHTDRAMTKTRTRLPGDAPRHPLPRAARYLDDVLVGTVLYRAACEVAGRMPAAAPVIARTAVRIWGDREFTDDSPRVFASHRGVRFSEMEYALPADRVGPALDEIRALISRRRWRISFPVEVRFAAADDRWLSPSFERESGYIAVHRYVREDPTAYFDAVEEVLLAHDGRPHWAKHHGLDAAALRPLYPRFDDFAAVRDRLDPGRVFANAHLERVLGG